LCGLRNGVAILSDFAEDAGPETRPDGVVLALSTATRVAPLASRVADAFACFVIAGALTAFGYFCAHTFWSVLLVSVLYAATLAPLTTIADALALGAA
jgi:PPP family 3-phenylpropionic acid transporter